MKRSEKAALTTLTLAVLLATGFATFYGLASQRRNAARANLAPPESIAWFKELNAADGARADNDRPPPSLDPDKLRGMQSQLDAFDQLFRDAKLTEEDAEWQELLEWLGKPESEWPAGMRERLRQFVEKFAPLIAEIRAVAERGGPACALDFSQGLAMELPHLAQLRNLARLLRADAEVAVDQGEFDRVLDDMAAMMQLGDAIRDEPILISQLVRIAISGIAYDTIGAVPAEALDPAQYDRLVDMLANADHRDSFASAFGGEAAASEVFFDDPSFDWVNLGAVPDNVFELGFLWLYTSPVGVPLTILDEGTTLDILSRVQAAALLPFYESRPQLEAIDEMVENLPRTRIFSRTMLPALMRANLAQARHEAMLDLVQMGLAVEAFHAEHGTYPQSFDEVADSVPGGVPVDPHTGQPYFYRPSEDSFLLYSVGMNLTDDGGYHHLRDGDIVWRGVQEDR